jgi:ABC-type transport system involved in cytochrome c biogenesis ATPase subunit
MMRGYDRRCGSLLEREAEVETLTVMARRVREGRGTVVLVRGEAGIGKTSLLRVLRDRVSPPLLSPDRGYVDPALWPEAGFSAGHLKRR